MHSRVGRGKEGSLIDFWAGLFFTAVAAIGWLLFFYDKKSFSSFIMRGDPGPFFLPVICLSIITLVAAYSLVISCFFPGQKKQKENTYKETKNFVTPGAFLVSIVVMPVIMQVTGSLLAIAIFSSIWFFVLGSRRKVGVFSSLIYGVLAAIGFYTIFNNILNVPLP